MSRVSLADVVATVMTEEDRRKLVVSSPDVRFKSPGPGDSVGGSVCRSTGSAGSDKSAS